MRIKAYVNASTGKTEHYNGSAISENNDGFERVPRPKWVEISEEPEGFYLYHFNQAGECIADTWHETLEEAKEQAKFEFEIKDNDWTTV